MGDPVIPVRPREKTDQEIKDQQTAEKAADREAHNEKTGGGNYPLADPNTSSALPRS